MRALALSLMACSAALPARAVFGQEATSPVVVLGTFDVDIPVVGIDLEELDDAPGAELLLIGAGGEVQAFATRRSAEGLVFESRGEARLPDPGRCLVDVAPAGTSGAEGRPQRYDVLFAGPRGVSILPHDGGGFGQPVSLAKRARFGLRTRQPLLADIAQDVNGDGRFDVVLPSATSCQLWMRGSDDESLRKAATVAVDVDLSSGRLDKAISNTLFSSFSIPRLTTRDVNGDQREDLLVVQDKRRAFHLQQEDGTFPEQPDVDVDLSIFRDTTPEAELRPGRTLAISDTTHYESRDLDDDGVPDYVLAHRRKVWVFHGQEGRGPQFTDPSNVLKAADDVTALVLAELDDDKYPDLLLFKVQIPSVAALIRALFADWRVEIDAIGYRNLEGASFGTKPEWKGQLAFELPSILSIVRDPEALIERFRSVGKSFREAAEGDLDGDGGADVAMLAEDDTSLDVWLGTGGGNANDLIGSPDAILREVFFEGDGKAWDIDRVLGWISSLASRRAERLTSGRRPDATLELRSPDEYRLVDFVTADLDGDGSDEILLRYERRASGSAVFDVLGNG